MSNVFVTFYIFPWTNCDFLHFTDNLPSNSWNIASSQEVFRVFKIRDLLGYALDPVHSSSLIRCMESCIQCKGSVL